jgi:hypothetical protein
MDACTNRGYLFLFAFLDVKHFQSIHKQGFLEAALSLVVLRHARVNSFVPLTRQISLATKETVHMSIRIWIVSTIPMTETFTTHVVAIYCLKNNES